MRARIEAIQKQPLHELTPFARLSLLEWKCKNYHTRYLMSDSPVVVRKGEKNDYLIKTLAGPLIAAGDNNSIRAVSILTEYRERMRPGISAPLIVY